MEVSGQFFAPAALLLGKDSVITQSTRHPNSTHHQHDSTRNKQLYIKYDLLYTQNHDFMLQLTNDVQKQGNELLFSTSNKQLRRDLVFVYSVFHMCFAILIVHLF
jgi:hypothetical protein